MPTPNIPDQPGRAVLMRWWRLPLAIFLGILLAPGLSVGYAASPETDDLTITSDRMELDDQKQVAIFAGDVLAKEKRLQLTAEKMTVNYRKSNNDTRDTPPKKSRQGGVEKIRAEGDVVLLQGESKGTAQEMIYLVEQQTLELLGKTGNASILHGNDRLEGRRIFLTIGEDHTISKISVQGGKERRVSARFTPTATEDNKQPPPHLPAHSPKRSAKPTVKLEQEP